jgi:hypothetical protein
MPIEIRWADDTQTTIIIQPIGRWTWDDFYQVSDENYRMMEAASGSHRINTILDWSQNATVPKDSLMHGRNILNNKRHPRQGGYVLCGMNRVTTSLFQMFVQLGSKTLKNFNAMTTPTLAEALAKLAELPQINDSPS